MLIMTLKLDLPTLEEHKAASLQGADDLTPSNALLVRGVVLQRIRMQRKATCQSIGNRAGTSVLIVRMIMQATQQVIGVRSKSQGKGCFAVFFWHQRCSRPRVCDLRQ